MCSAQQAKAGKTLVLDNSQRFVNRIVIVSTLWSTSIVLDYCYIIAHYYVPFIQIEWDMQSGPIYECEFFLSDWLPLYNIHQYAKTHIRSDYNLQSGIVATKQRWDK